MLRNKTRWQTGLPVRKRILLNLKKSHGIQVKGLDQWLFYPYPIVILFCWSMCWTVDAIAFMIKENHSRAAKLCLVLLLASRVLDVSTMITPSKLAANIPFIPEKG